MKSPKLSMTTILTALAVVSAIGGAAWTLDERWARKPWVEDQFAQVDRQYDLRELNYVDAQIVALERIRQRTSAEENLLRRLYMQRKVLCAKLNVQGC